MLNLLRDWLLQQGLGGQTVTFVTTAIEVAFVITLAAIADIVARRIIVRQLEKFAGQTSTVWDDIIVKRRVFHRLLHLAPKLGAARSARILTSIDGMSILTGHASRHAPHRLDAPGSSRALRDPVNRGVISLPMGPG